MPYTFSIPFYFYSMFIKLVSLSQTEEFATRKVCIYQHIDTKLRKINTLFPQSNLCTQVFDTKRETVSNFPFPSFGLTPTLHTVKHQLPTIYKIVFSLQITNLSCKILCFFWHLQSPDTMWNIPICLSKWTLTLDV